MHTWEAEHLDAEKRKFYINFSELCKKPFKDENGQVILKIAPTLLQENNKEAYTWTCGAIEQIIQAIIKPAQQEQCITLLRAFPWQNKYKLPLIRPYSGHALQLTVSRNAPKVMRFLVEECHVDPNTPTESLSTALHGAALANSPEIRVRLLLELGADPRCQDCGGSKAIDSVK